jgi:hypothetical protein
MLDSAPANAGQAPRLHPDRALEVRAYVALIDATLGGHDTFTPIYAAQRLIADLSESGKARLSTEPTGAIRFEMFGIATVTDAAAPGILQNWRNRAKSRLAGVA